MVLGHVLVLRHFREHGPCLIKIHMIHVYIHVFILRYCPFDCNKSPDKHSYKSSFQINIESTNFCRITIVNERRINRARLRISLYSNSQNRPHGKEFNTATFANLYFFFTLM